MIVREGLPFVFPAVVLAALFWALTFGLSSVIAGIVATLLTVGTLFLAYFFRDPDRTCPQGENLVLSPGDGKVILSETRTGNDGRPIQLVSIFLSVMDVHVNRIPISGVVTHLRHVPGKFHRAFEPAAVTENERTEITVRSAWGDVSFSQVAGILARRIVCNLKEGDQVSRGDRFGMIKFGSRVDLFLQPMVEVVVRVGDKVKGGESIVGRFSPNG